jgi:hypothetical protein
MAATSRASCVFFPQTPWAATKRRHSTYTASESKPDNRRLDACKHSLGLAWSEAEPIGFDGPGADRPEFDEVLRCDTKPIAVPAALVYGVTSLTMLRICPVKPAKENVGIGQYVHYRFQSSSRV